MLGEKLLCLYEPINGDYPTIKFCTEYMTCKSCPYYYDKDVKKGEKIMQNYEQVRKFLTEVPTDIAGRIKEEFFGWPKGTPVVKIEEWFDKKAKGEDTRHG